MVCHEGQETVEHGKRVGKARSVTKDKRLLNMVNVLVYLGPVMKDKRLLNMVNVLVKFGPVMKDKRLLNMVNVLVKLGPVGVSSTSHCDGLNRLTMNNVTLTAT